MVFTGYRGGDDEGPSPLVSFQAASGAECKTIWNRWAGPGDSLLDRLQRAMDSLDTDAADRAVLNVLACSMGCQLAARFLVDVLAMDSPPKVGEVLLVAPDPKHRRLRRDAEESAAGITSAYDEASELWGVSGPSGSHFVGALKDVAPAASTVRIVYAREDGVAEWDGNVEVMLAEVGSLPGVKLIEAQDGEVVVEHGLAVDLGSGDHQTDVHDRLWGATRFGSGHSRKGSYATHSGQIDH